MAFQRNISAKGAKYAKERGVEIPQTLGDDNKVSKVSFNHQGASTHTKLILE